MRETYQHYIHRQKQLAALAGTPRHLHLHLLGATGQVRRATKDNRPHLVVPVVALMEGVFQTLGQKAPEFVPLQTLASCPTSWNGRPVMLGHPTRDGRQVSANDPTILAEQALGQVFNARLHNDKLLLDAWIDITQAEAIGAVDLLERLASGEPVEVSIGAFVIADDVAGNHQGKPFRGTWKSILPDHLALLPTGRGACSCEHGCGTSRAAAAPHDRVYPDAPDPYAPGLAARAAAEGRAPAPDDRQALAKMSSFRDSFYASVLAARTPATSRVHLEPPDPYAAALEALRREQQ